MNDGFYQMTKWLPTSEIYIEKSGKHIKVNLDADLSSWIEHFQKIGLKRGRDFVVRRKKNGKKAIFRRGKSPFCNLEKYYPQATKG